MQFFVALTFYSVLSLAFPAQETFIPEAITSDNYDRAHDHASDDKSSHSERKSVDADVKAVDV